VSDLPNVLLLVSDQHNPHVSGFGGDPVASTPALDGLAASGVSFANAFCQAPVCTPSRMSFLTGLHVSSIGCYNNHWALFPEHRTFAHHFAGAGYETCLVGKMHFGGADQMHGFQHRPYGDLRHGLGHQPDPIDMLPNSGGVAHPGTASSPNTSAWAC
jgi:choline-sulfatase